MLKCRIGPKWRLAVSLRLIVCLLLGPVVSLGPALAESSPGVRTVLSTESTVTGEPIRYPSGAPAQITAVEITLQPGQLTGWHTHPVPLFGYILEGELTIDYGAKGQRVYVKGDRLAEAMNEAHNGRNMSASPVKILAVFIGMEGMQDTA